MEGFEFRVALLDDEGAQGEAEGDVVEGEGFAVWGGGDGRGGDGDFDGGCHLVVARRGWCWLMVIVTVVEYRVSRKFPSCCQV